jgi:hypothetical protein
VQQHGLHEREHRRRRADPAGQDQDRKRGKGPVAVDQPGRLTKVEKPRAH